MSVTLTVRHVPEQVRDALASEARRRGQSLQAFLVTLLEQQSRYAGNRRLLDEAAADLAAHGGAGEDAPDSADLVRAARPGEHP